MLQEKLHQWILRKHEEEERLTVADIMSHIQVHPWNLEFYIFFCCAEMRVMVYASPRDLEYTEGDIV